MLSCSTKSGRRSLLSSDPGYLQWMGTSFKNPIKMAGTLRQLHANQPCRTRRGKNVVNPGGLWRIRLGNCGSFIHAIRYTETDVDTRPNLGCAGGYSLGALPRPPPPCPHPCPLVGAYSPGLRERIVRFHYEGQTMREILAFKVAGHRHDGMDKPRPDAGVRGNVDAWTRTQSIALPPSPTQIHMTGRKSRP